MLPLVLACARVKVHICKINNQTSSWIHFAEEKAARLISSSSSTSNSSLINYKATHLIKHEYGGGSAYN